MFFAAVHMIGTGASRVLPPHSWFLVVWSLGVCVCVCSYSDLVDNWSPQYIAGGATQNSIRVCQWMMQVPNATSYIGCVGVDAFGAQLRESATRDGVNVMYLEDAEVPTGTCACLIVDKERSLVTNLQAANCYKAEHLQGAEVQAVVQQAKIVYSAGFFLTVSPDSMLQVAEMCRADEGRLFALNISAPFLPQVCVCEYVCLLCGGV